MFDRLKEDIAVVFDWDPAARTRWEVLTCYPGLHALAWHRAVANPLCRCVFKWQVRFMMPSRYDRASLPAPNNRQIMLKDVPPKTYAVIRFTGVPDGLLLAEKLEKLRHFMDAQHMRAESDPDYAFFNPPRPLPYLRRNVIMFVTTP